MRLKNNTVSRWVLALGLGFALILVLGFAASLSAHQDKPKVDGDAGAAGQQEKHHRDMMSGETGTMAGMHRLMMPAMDPAKGRKLFASKGCVACHSINGVGGHDATALDAHTMTGPMNPFEFAAKMWRMAPAMITAQEEALGGQILFTGDELSDIVAFVHDDAEQHKFTEADIPPEIAPWMHHAHGDSSGPEEHGPEIGHMHGEGGEQPHGMMDGKE